MTAPMLSPQQAAKVLRQGGLVAFPTDTVYGVAALADEALHAEPELSPNPDSAALRAFKGGRAEPFSLHAGSVDGALRYVAPRCRADEHALRLLTPRGVTVIVRWFRRGLGVRVVEHPAGSAMLEAAGAPVLATSANLHGQPVLNDPARIAELPCLAGVVDGGVLPARPASSVVRLLPAGLQVLRAGALAGDALAAVYTRSAQFVCLGNLNRSAFAHGLVAAMHEWLAERLPGFVPAFRARSSGLIARRDAAVPTEMIATARRYGVDLSRHQPERFDPADAADDVLVAMGDDVREAVQASGPTLAWRVHDPMGGPADGYARTAREVIQNLHTWLLHDWAPLQDNAHEQEFRRFSTGDKP